MGKNPNYKNENKINKSKSRKNAIKSNITMAVAIAVIIGSVGNWFYTKGFC